MDRGGNHVVAALRHVHVVVGMHGMPAGDLSGAARDDFVRRSYSWTCPTRSEKCRSGTRRPRPVRDFLSSLDDQGDFVVRQQAKFPVGLRGRALDQTERAQETGRVNRNPLIGKFSIARAVVAP